MSDVSHLGERGSGPPMQLLVHPVLVQPLKDWLERHDLQVRCIGRTSEDDLPSWIIEPKGES